ncbi:MAG: ComEC/Rec2 family competence protein [Mycobacterium sp.]|nr:ComEC/Rec2 family competence protein [Mycobacterium sp.]
MIASGCAVLAAGWALAGWRLGGRYPMLLAFHAGVVGAAVVGAGFGLAAGLRSDATLHHPLSQRFGDTAWMTAAADESPHSVGGGRLMFRARLLRFEDREMACSVTVFAAARDFSELTAGQPVRFRARISGPKRRDLTVAVLTVTGRPEFGQAGLIQRTAQSLRKGFSALAREVLPAGQAAILPGLVLGDTAMVDAATTAEFRTAGLTHLTAVSGANVTIVCGVVLLCAGLIGPRTAVVLAGLALAMFVVVVQPGASVLRAAVMGSITLLAVLTSRRHQTIPALAATVLAVLLWAPQLAVDVGFALSVSATAALVLVAPVWSGKLVARGWPKVLADAVCVALAAHVVTAPLIAAISGRLSLVSVLANVVVAVVIPPITVLGTAAAALSAVWPGAAGLLIRFTGPELWWLLSVGHTAAEVPGASVPVPTGWAGLACVGALTITGVLLWSRLWFRRLCALLALCVLAWSVSGLVGPA